MTATNDMDVVPVTITTGTALSAPVSIGGKIVVGIQMSAGWDAASLTVQAAPVDQTTFGELQDGVGGAVSFTVAAGIVFGVDPAKWRGQNTIKLRSGTSGAPVNQTATRVINLLCK